VSNRVEAFTNDSVADCPPHAPVPEKSKCDPRRGTTVIGGSGVIGPERWQRPEKVDADAGPAKTANAAATATIADGIRTANLN
jgi:hypothetical protein